MANRDDARNDKDTTHTKGPPPLLWLQLPQERKDRNTTTPTASSTLSRHGSALSCKMKSQLIAAAGQKRGAPARRQPCTPHHNRFKLFLTLVAAKLRSGFAFLTGEPSVPAPPAPAWLPSPAWLLLLAALAPEVVSGPCGRLAVGGCACRLVMSLAYRSYSAGQSAVHACNDGRERALRQSSRDKALSCHARQLVSPVSPVSPSTRALRAPDDSTPDTHPATPAHQHMQSAF